MSIADFLDATRRSWKVIVIVTLVGGVLAGIITIALDMRKTIEASSTVTGVFVDPDVVTEVAEQALRAGKFRTETRLFVPRDNGGSITQTLVEVSKSPALLDQVAQASGATDGDVMERIAVTSVPDSDVLIISTYGDSAAASERLNGQFAAVLEQEFGQLFPGLPRGPVVIDRETFAPTDSTSESNSAWELIAAEPKNTLANISTAAILEVEATSSAMNQVAWLVTSGVSGGQPALTTQSGTLEITATATDSTPPEVLTESAVEAVQARIESLDASHPLAGSRFVVVSTATVTPTTASSRLATNVILGLFTGLTIALSFVFYRASRDTTIRRPDQIVRFVDALPLAAIGCDPPSSKEARESEYRQLRNTLVFGAPDARVICLVEPTSSVQAEGMMGHLAVSLVKADRSVLLIDTDPSGMDPADTVKFPEAHSPGETCHRPELGCDGMRLVVPKGRLADYLSSRAFKDLLTSAAENYDYVLCFGGAVLASTEAAAVAAQCDAAIVTVRQGSSTTVDLATCLVQLMQVHVALAGIVVLGVSETDIQGWSVLPPAFLETT